MVLFAVCLIDNALAHAKTVTLVDEQGVPFANAVISVQRPTDNNAITLNPVEEIAIMDQVNLQFKPTTLVIEQGQQVVFPNSDNLRHHVYSFSEPKPFEIKLYAGDSIPPIQFNKAGIVVLGCNIHDSMLGFIYVKDHTPSWETNDRGEADINTTQSEILVWHPDISVDHLKRVPFTLKDNNDPVVLTIPRVKALEMSKRVFGNSKFKRQ